ncbi:response regulator [Patescibacteria group bacterium]|jgi:DNA-binding response OmpR family regulator|nr:response regulator [Patescibacteria group bacterium]
MKDHTDVHVLIIEDDPILGDLVELIIKKSFTVHLAATGEQADAYLEAHDTPDIILIDIILPDANGFDILRKIRSHPTHQSALCVMFTNLSQESDKKRAFELGADEYFVKADLDLDKLPDILYQLLEQRRSGVVDRSPGADAPE